MDGARSPKYDSSFKHATIILLDTNFLLLPFQRRIDIFEEIERLIGGHVQFVVLSQIKSELERLASTGSLHERKDATSSLQLVQRHCRIADETMTGTTGLDADKALIHFAKKSGAVVATNDRILRHALVEQGCKAIFLRKLAILAITE